MFKRREKTGPNADTRNGELAKSSSRLKTAYLFTPFQKRGTVKIPCSRLFPPKPALSLRTLTTPITNDMKQIPRQV
jgi:hypothetical protein